MAILQPVDTPGKTDWFVHDRFGLFIHWGIYSMPARHEWVKSREEIPDAEYQRYFERFDPDLYDPRDWARTAKAAGTVLGDGSSMPSSCTTRRRCGPSTLDRIIATPTPATTPLPWSCQYGNRQWPSPSWSCFSRIREH